MRAATAAACAGLLVASGSAQASTPTGKPGDLVLRLLDFHGAPVSSAEVTVLTVKDFGHMAALHYLRPPDRLQPADFLDGRARLSGLPAGDYVLVVTSPPLAPTASFRIRLFDDAPTEVCVRMHRGAVATGIVVDEQGRPLAGAIVKAEVPSDDRTGTFLPIAEPEARRFLPRGAATVRTDERGAYRLAALARGNHRLVVQREERVAVRVDFACQDDSPLPLPPIALARGTRVKGEATVDGVRVSRVKIILSWTPVTAPSTSDVLPLVQSITAFTDDHGRFQVAEPLGDGIWQAVAAAAGNGNDVFTALQQMQQSRQRLELTASPRERELSFALTTSH
ncbi:MAG: carboxypeptidase-like regulatory domain-containing protein [Planctomycetota bacterium]